MKKSGINKIKWYDNGNNIASLIILSITVAIICSQSFAVVGKSSIEIFNSIINHNSIYLFLLIYFTMLKFKIGKMYFNYLNLFLVFMYFIISATSLLTAIQSFSLNTLLSFLLYLSILVYLFHTMFRDTRVWNEFKLGNSPFNEIKNDTYYSTIAFLVAIMLVVNLISTVVVSGVLLSFLDSVIYLLFGRYIFLYRSYLDVKKKDANNKGNFDELRSDIKDVVNNIKDKTDLDEKLVEFKDKAEDFIKDKKIDEKVENIKDKIEDAVDDIKNKANDFINDKKVENAKDDISNTEVTTKNKRNIKKKGVEK